MITSRRAFVGGALSMGATAAMPVRAAVAPAMIIDTHVHLYDTSRPGGTPWPSRSMTSIYRPVLPPELIAIAKPLGVTGVIAVEASPLVEDNQFILDLADRYPFIVGTCGDLHAGEPGFAHNLERFAKDSRFLGVRCSSLWDRDFVADTRSPAFVADLKLLAAHGLQIDYWGAPPQLDAVLRLSDAIPDLRIVIDHLPFMPLIAVQDHGDPAAIERNLQELAKRPQIYAKLSGGVRKHPDGTVSTDPADYRPGLDHVWELFGQQRLIYGSNWPLSNTAAPYHVHFDVVRAYFETKGQAATDDFFWRNSQAAYRWRSARPAA